jgi:flagella synthesis protein FlgN
MIDQALLQQQQKRLLALQEVLEQEFAALKQRQVIELAELANKKTVLLSQLTALDDQARQSISSDEYKSWRESLNELLRSCREKNEINGKLIEMNLIASRKLSSILAQARDRDSMTYNDHGLTQPRSSMPLGIKA